MVMDIVRIVLKFYAPKAWAFEAATTRARVMLRVRVSAVATASNPSRTTTIIAIRMMVAIKAKPPSLRKRPTPRCPPGPGNTSRCLFILESGSRTDPRRARATQEMA